MSIRGVISDWRDRGELILLTPLLESDPIGRVLFISRDIYEAVIDLGEVSVWGGFGRI
jgi:hypothetical protein